MRVIAAVLVLLSLPIGVAAAEPPGVSATYRPDRDMCYSQPPDLHGAILSSEISGEWRTLWADDFVFPEDRTITRIRWWGAYWFTSQPCDPGMTPSGFHLLFFRGDECLPGATPELDLYIPGPAGETLVECYPHPTVPIFRYEADVEVPIPGNVRYWFAAEMGDHQIPPQWGRLGAGTASGCMSAWGSIGGSEWFWVPAEDMGEYSFDVSQEFECDSVVPVLPTTWGRVKAIYH